jgi:hypothetical protein
MRDQTRKVMKAQLAVVNDQIDHWTREIAQVQGLEVAYKERRDELRAERDLIKADLDAEEVHIEHHEELALEQGPSPEEES